MSEAAYRLSGGGACDRSKSRGEQSPNEYRSRRTHHQDDIRGGSYHRRDDDQGQVDRRDERNRQVRRDDHDREARRAEKDRGGRRERGDDRRSSRRSRSPAASSRRRSPSQSDDEDHPRRRKEKDHHHSKSHHRESSEDEDSSSDEDEESLNGDRRHRRERKKRSHRHRRSSSVESRSKKKRREKESQEQRRERKLRKKEKREKKKLKRSGSNLNKHKCAVNEYGKFGIISEADMYRKDQEFRAWLVEEKMLNPETVPVPKMKELFRVYMEDYNTATLPHEKFYALEKYEAKMNAIRSGETTTENAGYDPRADEAALAAQHKRVAKTDGEVYIGRAQLEELRKLERDRVEASRMKRMGMEVKESMGVRYERD